MVVDEYVVTATPVSSRALATREQLGVSSATIRNELAKLEEAGLITHPYTSAGRVPSDAGYRLYVQELMAEEPVVEQEQLTIRHQFHQARAQTEEWLQLAATVLAAAVGNVAVITRPRSPAVRLRQVQLVHLRDEMALVVAVLDDAGVEQCVVALDAPTDQPDLTRRAERLNAAGAGGDARTLLAWAETQEAPADRLLARELAELLESHVRDGDVYVDGLRAALRQPEFEDPDRMLGAVEHLRAYHLRAALPDPFEGPLGAARVTIGDDHADGWLREWSVVSAPFGDGTEWSGMIAVLGPTRMRYGYTLPRVRYLSELMSALFRELGR